MSRTIPAPAPAAARSTADDGRRWDPHKIARAAILIVWASFFSWLLFTGDVYRYIGLRTHWVVVFGAVTLVVASIAQILSLRSPSPAPLTGRDLAGLGVLLCPILVVVMIPAPSLGASAASTKATGGILSSDALVPSAPRDGEAISFVDIHFASASETYAADAGIGDGYRVELTGFVTHSAEAPDGGFALTRFFISCCAADAIPYSVGVDPGTARAFADDTWLTVSGALYKEGDQYVLRAEKIATVPEPKDPYIY
jgi:putative membrane protein